MICHNERLADPLDEMTRAIGAISKKTRKTEADHTEIARLEFLGGLYLNGPAKLTEGFLVPADDSVVPCLPAWNVVRCLQDGAARHRRGKDVLRGVQPIVEYATLEYEGPTDINELWKSGEFALRKGVGVGAKKIMRTRPVFWPWTVTLRVSVDPIVFDLDTLEVLWRDAGRYSGLGDMRPIYGRFIGTIEP